MVVGSQEFRRYSLATELLPIQLQIFVTHGCPAALFAAFRTLSLNGMHDISFSSDGQTL